jgi:hypothetical protein
MYETDTFISHRHERYLAMTVADHRLPDQSVLSASTGELRRSTERTERRVGARLSTDTFA